MNLSMLVSYSIADSIIDKFPLLTAGRTIKTGLYGALAFGLVEDALGLARGRKLRYIDFLRGHNQVLPEGISV